LESVRHSPRKVTPNEQRQQIPSGCGETSLRSVLCSFRVSERAGVHETLRVGARAWEKDQVCASEEVERHTNEIGKNSGRVQQPPYIAVPIGPPA